jgi:hypothetical protein
MCSDYGLVFARSRIGTRYRGAFRVDWKSYRSFFGSAVLGLGLVLSG